MERFVRSILAGGIALVAGLWLVSLTVTGSTPWLVGAVLVALGIGGLAAGIWVEVDLDR